MQLNSFQFLLCVSRSLQINTCNGFYCDYFTPNNKHKPTMWTEAWTGWYSPLDPSHADLPKNAFRYLRMA